MDSAVFDRIESLNRLVFYSKIQIFHHSSFVIFTQDRELGFASIFCGEMAFEILSGFRNAEAF